MGNIVQDTVRILYMKSYVTAHTKTYVDQHEVVCKAHFSVAAWHMDAKFET